MGAVYETLIGLDPTDHKTLIPRLATRWSSNSNLTQWTFILNPKARFSDGSPVTSADVKYSWTRLKFAPSGSRAAADDIATMDAPDASTVVVRFNKPNATFVDRVTFSSMGIVNAKVAEVHGAALTDGGRAAAWFNSNSAGSGPFVLASFVVGSELKLKRNDSYWGRPAVVPEVTFRDVKDPAEGAALVEQGVIDVAVDVPNSVASTLASPDVHVERAPSASFVWLQLSPRHDQAGGSSLTPDVRSAIRLALDYDGLLNVAVGSAGRKQASAVPNDFAGGGTLAAPKQDLAGARALMAKANVVVPELEARFPNTKAFGVDSLTLMAKVQADLQAIGIKLRLNPVDWSVLETKAVTPVALGYWGTEDNDPRDIGYLSLADSSVTQVLSTAGPSAAEGETLDKAVATKDIKARVALIRQLDQMIYDDDIVIPLVNPDSIVVARSNITGVQVGIADTLDLRTISRG